MQTTRVHCKAQRCARFHNLHEVTNAKYITKQAGGTQKRQRARGVCTTHEAIEL